jgi:hypothetical protein
LGDFCKLASLAVSAFDTGEGRIHEMSEVQVTKNHREIYEVLREARNLSYMLSDWEWGVPLLQGADVSHLGDDGPSAVRDACNKWFEAKDALKDLADELHVLLPDDVLRELPKTMGY